MTMCTNKLVLYSGSHPCPPSEQAYVPEKMMSPPYLNNPQCLTEEELNSENQSFCEPYVPPKKASKNCTCDCNNFIKCETGYRQATKCVCAPYKSSHIHFVT